MIDKEERADRQLECDASEDSDFAAAVSLSANPRHAIWLSLVAFAAYLFGHLPATVLIPVGLFDEGLQLSVPFFVSRGLAIFQDFYVPYGPGNGYLGVLSSVVGGDSILATRVEFVLISATLAALATYLVCRRRGLLAGLFMAVIAMSFSTWAAYVMVYVVLVAGALTLVGWTRDVYPLSALGREHEQRLVVAGVLFALAAWFRFEFAFILMAWSVAVATRPVSNGKRWPWSFWIPWLIGSAPYAFSLIRGGGDELFYALRYALVDFGTYRGVEADLSEPLELVGQLLSNSSLDWDAFTIAMSFVAGWIGLGLVAVGPILDRIAPAWRPFSRDKSRTIVIIGATALFAMYTLSVRADHGHASQLVVPVWLVLLWSPIRWPRLGKAVAVSLTVVAIVAGQAVTLDRWQQAEEAWNATATAQLPRAARVPFLGSDAEQLAHLDSMWTEIGAPDEVFVANRVNDLAHLNAAIAYWLLEAEPASWMTTFDPGFADQEKYQRLIAEDLCESQAPVVLAQQIQSPEHPRDRRFSPYLDRFLALNYKLFDRNDRFDLRLPSDNRCALPDASYGFADLELIRVRLMGEGDLVPAAIIGEWQLEMTADEDLRGDRILIAESAGLWHGADEVTGLHRELLSNWRLARSVSPPQEPLARSLDLLDPDVTGVALYVNGLLAGRDSGMGFEVEHLPNALFYEAVMRDPSLGTLNLLLRSLQRNAPGYLEVATLIHETHPANAGALEHYGIALFDVGDHVGALDAFADAAAAAGADDVGRMMNHMGSALRGTGDLACSAAAYEAALAAGFDQAGERLASVLTQGGDPAGCTDVEVKSVLDGAG